MRTHKRMTVVKVGRGRPASPNKKVPCPSMLVYDMPVALRLAFKSKCASANVPICAKIRELMEGYVAAK